MKTTRFLLLALLAISLLGVEEASAFFTVSQYPDATLFPLSGQWGDQFGGAVAISGNDVVVGSAGDDVTYTDQGSAYVFTHGGGSWPLVQKLTASNGAYCDQFGNSVAIDGDTIVVGAFARGPLCGHEPNHKDWGAAYVFERTGGVWTETQALTVIGLPDDGWFGWDVAISGDYIAVSALLVSKVYIFKRDALGAGVWGQVAELPGSGQFGIDISLDGDLLLVGDNIARRAWVYDRISNWTVVGTLAPPGASTVWFAQTVEISGNTAVVGDATLANGAIDGVGIAHIYEDNGPGWAHTAALLPSVFNANSFFGISASISGDTIVVGQFTADPWGQDSGAAFMFSRDGGGNWVEGAALYADGGTAGIHNWFGRKVATTATRGIVGAPTWFNNGNTNRVPGYAAIFDFAAPPDPPGAATLVSPAGNEPDTTPSYVWDAVAEADSYLLWVDGSSGNLINQSYTAAEAGCDSGTGQCSVTPSTTLSTGDHSWWIQTQNAGGSGPWSARMDFTVSADPPAAADPVSPDGAAGLITTSTPTYIWNSVAESTMYQLWVDDGAGGNVFQQWYTAADAGCAGGGSCSVTPSTALADGDYSWWVRTSNANGNGPWSTRKDFTVDTGPPAAANLVAPEGSIADTTPTFTWDEVAGATWYFVWVNDVDSGNTVVFAEWYSLAWTANCSGGTCSIVSPQVLSSGNYRWWVRTWSSAGFGPWSASKDFTVQ